MTACADPLFLRSLLTNREATQERMPGFTVRLGFGLHYGWAVEGAIGSPLKIDASYLSPHVNMASRLEAATKQYGTAILLSDSLFCLLSPLTQSLCRLIDRVTVKGSLLPVTLYTYDVPDVRSRGIEWSRANLSLQLEKDLEFATRKLKFATRKRPCLYRAMCAASTAPLPSHDRQMHMNLQEVN
jgi:class 3 adenylate cyclase